MLVKIDNRIALEMLIDRVECWTNEEDIIELYKRMYESYIDGGCFDGGYFDVMEIVDNDYINNCSIIDENDEAYKEINELYIGCGCGDISCENGLNNGYSFIEAEYNGKYLVRC